MSPATNSPIVCLRTLVCGQQRAGPRGESDSPVQTVTEAQGRLSKNSAEKLLERFSRWWKGRGSEVSRMLAHHSSPPAPADPAPCSSHGTAADLGSPAAPTATGICRAHQLRCSASSSPPAGDRPLPLRAGPFCQRASQSAPIFCRGSPGPSSRRPGTEHRAGPAP